MSIALRSKMKDIEPGALLTLKHSKLLRGLESTSQCMHEDIKL